MTGMPRRGLLRRLGAFMLVVPGLLFLLFATRGVAREQPFLPAETATDAAGLSIMTYNVEGLPWPARLGRGDALARIGERLASMRAIGVQPRIVLLQEAFSDDAKAISAASGHRYAVLGPDTTLAGQPAASRSDRVFAGQGSFLKGERSGKLLDSGLVILSDYPILSVKRSAFPVAACAGYDCLANKGMVMAVVAVPGQPGPIAIVNVHLNSKRASGVGVERADAAFRRQVGALGRFLAANRAPRMPMIVAGDFNIGHSATRRALVMEVLSRHHGTTPRDVLTDCAERSPACRDQLTADARASRSRAKDWQFLLPGSNAELTVRRVTTPFGRERDGSMLSDHVGYTAHLARTAGSGLQLSPRG